MTLFEIQIFWFTLAPSYYGLMYAWAFLIGYYYLLKKNLLKKEDLDSLFLFIVFWVILWGRIWYILFYDFSFYMNHFTEIIKIWKGGMSFHGGMIWVIFSVLLFSKIYKVPFYKLIDEIALIAPIGIFLGRIWNYINKELLGFPYEWWLAVEKNGVSYFPSPLLEAFLEGFILFVCLYFLMKKRKFYGQIWAIFLIVYGIFRIFIEIFVRTPDVHIWYIAGIFTLGTLLSIPMILAGIFFYIYLSKRQKIWI